jgi:hypothetical protein
MGGRRRTLCGYARSRRFSPLSRLRLHAPDDIANIVCDEQGAGPVSDD